MHRTGVGLLAFLPPCQPETPPAGGHLLFLLFPTISANRERNLNDEHGGGDGDGGGDHYNHSNNHHDFGVDGDELLSLKVKMMVMMVASIFDEYLKCI